MLDASDHTYGMWAEALWSSRASGVGGAGVVSTSPNETQPMQKSEGGPMTPMMADQHGACVRAQAVGSPATHPV